MAPSSPQVLAYYFPGYHPDPLVAEWHGAGWTEWELVKAAHPRFEDHRQPIVSAWGTFDESDPAWAARQVDLAADHRLTGFLFDWYWYNGRPFLQGALENGFLKAPNRERLKFALMWANHDWLNIQPATFRNDPAVLARGGIDPQGFEELAAYVIEHYFREPNYFMVDGLPYFSIYDLGTFIEGMGGIGGARAALDQFRARACSAGLDGIHIAAVTWRIQVLASEVALQEPAAVIAALGIDSLDSYTWIHDYDIGAAEFPRASYREAAEQAVRTRREVAERFQVPYHPNVSMGWDPSPRTVQTDTFERRGYPWTSILAGNTPAAFSEAFREAIEFARGNAASHCLITVNAWNEWTEGSYLLPDALSGNAYLEVIRDALG